MKGTLKDEEIKTVFVEIHKPSSISGSSLEDFGYKYKEKNL